MLFLIFGVSTLVLSSLYIYFIEWCRIGDIRYWSIIFVLIGAYIVSLLLFFIFLYFHTLIFSRPAKDLYRPRTLQRKVTQQACYYALKMARIVSVVKHKDRLPKGQFLLVQNHQSLFDPLATIWAFRDTNITYVMKKEALKLPIIGRFLAASGFIPLDRSNNRNAVVSIKKAAKRIEEGYNSIGIFPEGTRSHSPMVADFKNGAFKIAEWSKCPIVVCFIDNAYKIRYHSIFKKTKILIEIVKVLNYEDYKDMSTQELGDLCHKLITEGMAQRRAEYDWLREQYEKEKASETIIGYKKK